MSTLQQQINSDIKEAMKAKAKETLTALRALSGAIKQFEVDNRIDADDAKVLEIITKQVKQRKDSIAQFTTAGREDLIAKEEAELAVISNYLPAQLSTEEIEAEVTNAIATLGASSMADMGKVMGVLKAKLGSSADMGVVSQILKAQLG